MRDIKRSVHLQAVVENYLTLTRLSAPGTCAAVVKADGYGLGMTAISQALLTAGCKEFFVATLAEGEQLRGELPTARIFILNGATQEQVQRIHLAQLVPVLNTSEELRLWSAANKSATNPHPCALHVDTGMQRLGLNDEEFTALLAAPEELQQLNPVLIMSHLVSAEQSAATTNQLQLEKFKKLLSKLPPQHKGIATSLANSSGIFLGDSFKFDVCRAGAACYGINPVPGKPNPMQAVVEICAPIIQIREVSQTSRVGYGGTGEVTAGSRLATIAAGYADGYPRQASNRANIQIREWLAPVVGRVSMDLISVDISHLPKRAIAVGDPAYLLGPLISADDLAGAADTIGYEILTNLGRQAETSYGD